MMHVLLVPVLVLVHVRPCSAFGFNSCSQDFPRTNKMWCFDQNIENISDVVATLPKNISTLNLSKNKIAVVPVGSFARLADLTGLDLSQNRLVSLSDGAFRGLNLLELLNLTANNISHIHSDAFHGLDGLKSLLLSHNVLASVPAGMFANLPAIRNVVLSLNALGAVDCRETGGSATLRQLDLFANNIQRLDVSCFPALENIRLSNNSKLELRADAFSSNRRLKSLILQGLHTEALAGLSPETKRKLSSVSFSLSLEKSPLTICGLLKDMDRLQKITVDLKGSRPARGDSALLDCATPDIVYLVDANLGNVSRLTTKNATTRILYLENCGLREIPRATFDGYRELKTLWLNTNKLVIHRDTFRDVTGLNFLSLDKAGLRDVDASWFPRLKNLTVLSLTKNEVARLKENIFGSLARLEQLYLHFNLLKYIHKNVFSNLRRLKKLNLSMNILYYIENGSFRDLTELRYMDLSGNRLQKLTSSTMSSLVNLRKLILFNNRLHFQSYESPFVNLTSLEYLEMNYQGPAGQGIGHIGPKFFQGQRRLTSLNVGNSIEATFHRDAFVPLVNLEMVYFARIIMKNTNLSALLSPLKKLKKLTFNRVDLDGLPANLLPPDNSLEILRVKSNHIRTWDKSLLEGLPRLRSLDVQGNPLSCTCANAWFKTWAIQNVQTQVCFLYSLRCDDGSLLSRFEDKACSYENTSFTLFVSCCVTDALFVGACLAARLFGPSLRYLLLILRFKLHGRRGAAGARFQYDAFISYSSKDEAWVIRQMVGHLEKPAAGGPGFKLCLHHRDFRPGSAVVDNIETAIYRSRHTICVVTRNFLRSTWCSLEFQLASLRLLCDGGDGLLLVFPEEIPEHRLSPFTRLRKILRKRTYLVWPESPEEQDVFWARLKDALRGCEEEEEEDGGAAGQLARLIG